MNRPPTTRRRWPAVLVGLALLIACLCLLPQGILGFVETHSGGSLILVIAGALCLVAGLVFLWRGRKAFSGSAPAGRLDEDPINKLPIGGAMMWGKDGVDGMIHSRSTDFENRD
jgi:hypothetical protein